MTVWLSIKDVCDRYQITKSSIYRKVSSGELPAPHKIGSVCSRWHITELEEHDQKILRGEK